MDLVIFLLSIQKKIQVIIITNYLRQIVILWILLHITIVVLSISFMFFKVVEGSGHHAKICKLLGVYL